VEVIGHGTVGVDGERFARGGGLEFFENGRGVFVFGEKRFAFVAADGDEIIAFSEVVERWKADVFAGEGGHLIV
jgi:hypothetical protein